MAKTGEPIAGLITFIGAVGMTSRKKTIQDLMTVLKFKLT